MEKERGVIIIGASGAIAARAAIMLAQGFKVVSMNYDLAKKIGIPILENKINVIDFKHLNTLIIKKIKNIDN